MTGLYLHIPFCVQKCHYCNFVITLQHSGEARQRFFTALRNEILHAVQNHGRPVFSTFYLGGGTPSLLSAREMTELTDFVRAHFDFEPGFEWTCEFNPGDVDAEKMKIFRQLGVNRISLGVQAFQDHLLKDMGRQHTVRDIEATVETVRNAGIKNISFDLISGLPGQSLEDFQESLDRAAALRPSQVSLYDLEIHPSTPWGIQYQKGTLSAASEDLRADMFQAAIDTLTGAGLEQYEISTFAKPGFESRHNLIYWHNREYWGFGPGAFTYRKGVRSQFSLDVPQYLQKCGAGDWEPAVQDLLTEEEKERETLVTALRLKQGIDLERLPIIRSKIESRLAALEEGNLLSRSGKHIALTPRGRFLAEQTFGMLIGKLC